MKKKKKQRKRFETLNVQLDKKHINPTTGRIEINVLFDEVNGQNKIILANTNETIPNHSITRGYFGENKTRILSVLPTDSNDHSFDIIKKMKRYDRIVAMDTNSSFFQQEKISLGIAFHVTGKIKRNEIEWEFIPINHLFLLMGHGEKIENKNWKQLIEYIQKHKNYQQEHKIGLIVDSDLGNLEEYNKQQKPLVDDFFLPVNFELIYASDRANDNILNEVMLTCHKTSKDILKRMIEIFQEEYTTLLNENLKNK